MANISNTLFQALHFVILVAFLAWAGYLMVKLVGPLLTPEKEARPRQNVRAIVAWGAVILALVLLDQFLLGRFR